MAHIRLVILPSSSAPGSASRPDACETNFPVAAIGAREAQLALRDLDRAERLRVAEIAEREKRAHEARAIVLSSRPAGSSSRFGDTIASLRHGPVSREVRKRCLLLDGWYRLSHAEYRVGLSSLSHLLGVGAVRDLAPNPFFDPVWYRHTHGLEADDVPLLHYLRDGAAQALAPSALFDTVAYLQSYPELAMEPDLLGHYIGKGIREGRAASVVHWSKN